MTITHFWKRLGIESQTPPRLRVVFLGGKGRLGNQVFQWLALDHRFAGCDIWAPGWRSLTEVFELPRPVHLGFRNPWLDSLLRRKRGRRLMEFLFGRLRLGGHVHEPRDDWGDGNGQMVYRAGMARVVYVNGGYYQNLQSLLRPADFRRIQVRDSLLQRARTAVERALEGRPWPQIVMHVRRSDYLHFKPHGLSDVVLPASYYLNAAAEARRGLDGVQSVLVVSDDADWCRTELAALGDFGVVNNSEAIDFSILTLFPVIVIANSTFSLAAACVGPQTRRVIAPAYWLGHGVARWAPSYIRSDDARFTYV